MENTTDIQQQTDNFAPQERPEFLKIISILSFVACGLMILVYTIGSATLGISAETISGVWDKVLETQPQLENVDPVQFFREVGKLCVYNLIANIASLVGVILMWRLNKIGFYIYVVAELITNFLSLNLGLAPSETQTYGSIIFSVLIDMVFIIMYAVNLKHMHSSNSVKS